MKISVFFFQEIPDNQSLIGNESVLMGDYNQTWWDVNWEILVSSEYLEY